MQGATVVDFAYHVHTEVGNQMVSARVNGKPCSVAHVLSDADVVEIRRYEGPATTCQILTHQVQSQASWTMLAQGLLYLACTTVSTITK